VVDRYTVAARDLTPGGAVQSLAAEPYYRDDSCFDDATGTNPGPRLKLRSAGEPSVAPDGTPRTCWKPSDGPVESDHFFQGDLGTHGVHLLFLVDSDNARQTVPLDEIVVEQRQVFLPGDAGDVGEEYGRSLEKPLVVRAATATFAEAPLATSLAWTGDTTTAAGNVVRLAARLVDENGNPVAGAVVLLSLDGAGAPATTGADGEASRTQRVTGPPHAHQARGVYQGDAGHTGSSVDQSVADRR
jgi:hypothetical protein